MPDNARGKTKNKLAYAINNLETAQNHIIEISPPYEKHHPEYYKWFCQFVQGLELMRGELKRMRDRI